MGQGYLGIMTPKTYLRLKKTNPKLLVCHGCRRELQVKDEVVWAAGAMRKRYDRACADKYNVDYSIPEDFAQQKAEVEALTSSPPQPEVK